MERVTAGVARFWGWVRSRPVTTFLLAAGLVLAGVLHELGWPRIDALSAGLIAGGLALLLTGRWVVLWFDRRVSSVKVGGLFELAMAEIGTEDEGNDSGEGASTAAIDSAELADSVERHLRQAAKWTPLKKTRARSDLTETLAKRGFLSQIDGAAILRFFSEDPAARTAAELRSIQAIDRRLKISVLQRVAELAFEKRGLVPQRPEAPRWMVGYHFAISHRRPVDIYVTVGVLRRTASKYADDRAEDLAQLPATAEKWLVTPDGTEFKNESVRSIPIADLGDAIDRHLAR